MLFISTVYGQTWYQVGEDYQFRSKSESNPERTYVLSIVYDAGGNAVITKTIESNQSKDKVSSWYFGPSGDLAVNSSVNHEVQYEIIGQGSFFIVPFASPSEFGRMGNGGDKTISCACSSSSSGKCSVSTILTGNTSCSSCVVEENCLTCKMTVKDSNSKSYNSSTLLLKANNVKVQ